MLIIVLVLSYRNGEAKEAPKGFRAHVDWPYFTKTRKLYLDVYYSNEVLFKGKLNVQFYKYSLDNDSVLVLKKQNFKVKFKGGVNKVKIDFSKSDSNTHVHPKFYEVLSRTNHVAPGVYKIFIDVKDSLGRCNVIYKHEVDSNFSNTSSMRSDLNGSLKSKRQGHFFSRRKSKIKTSIPDGVLKSAKNKIDKTARKRGLTVNQYEKNEKAYADFFFEDWFTGRYEIDKSEPLQEQIKKQESKLSGANINSLVGDDLDHLSLFSQFRAINSEKNKKKVIEGNVELTSNLSTGQEQGSQVDNNYHELKGRIEIPIGGLPIDIEGLYTTQDIHRTIKSSYVRLHYDVNKIKNELQETIRSYNRKVGETVSKSVGMEQLYKSSINNLERQRERLLKEVDLEKKLSDAKDDLTDTSGAAGGIKTILAKKAASKAQKAETKLKQIEELDKRIDKYKAYLKQNKNIGHFDSSLHAKTKDIQNMSYKQMAKKGGDMLPDGQAKKFVAGLTSFDAGMFPKSASKYTMAGQQIKGADVSYDFGFCEATATIGKTEYVGRDGSLDKYTCYSGIATFNPLHDQKVSLIYYGYTADKTILKGDDFFKNVNIAAPGFFRPVHIVAVAYDGSITEFITVGAEAASSFKEVDKTDVLANATREEKMAYHFESSGNIPNTLISLEASYDKTGRAFENSTLPFALSGTQRYRVAGKDDFFRSFLTLGVEYNRLMQDNLASKTSNTKWGFELKTNSKRYPNLSASYKPYTTFRSSSDTLTIPQRPLFGSVLTSNLTYQIKKKGKAIRFSVLYTKNETVMDTTENGSKLIQASGIYTDKKFSNSLTVGSTEQTGTTIDKTVPNKSNFINVTSTYQLSRSFGLSIGQDFGWASFGFCKNATTGGVTYRPDKKPYYLRCNIRYNTFKLLAIENWKSIYSGVVDLGYNFKIKNPKSR
jgi:hypothetical protein